MNILLVEGRDLLAMDEEEVRARLETRHGGNKQTIEHLMVRNESFRMRSDVSSILEN